MNTDYQMRREQRMQERQQQGGGEQRSRLFKRFLLWGGALAVLAGLGWGMVRLASNVQLPADGGQLMVPVSDADHQKGAANASITLVEYGDFQCPACATFEPLVQQLLKDPALKDRLRLVYRHFPLTSIHANAQLSSQASEAASLQGKFWEMHDKLYTTQIKWSAMSNKGAREVFIGYARELGLNTEQFERDMDSSAVKSRITADADGGQRSGVNSTPSFFVNGVRMPFPQSYEQFKNYVANGIPATTP